MKNKFSEIFNAAKEAAIQKGDELELERQKKLQANDVYAQEQRAIKKAQRFSLTKYLTGYLKYFAVFLVISFLLMQVSIFIFILSQPEVLQSIFKTISE